MNYTHIIRRPIITEKSTQDASADKVVFQVDPKATKGQIKHAIETAFDVAVIKINTLSLAGKTRRVGKSRRLSQTPRWKKAVIQLKPGDKIEVFNLKENK